MASDGNSPKHRGAVVQRLTDWRRPDMLDDTNTNIIELTPDMEIDPGVVPRAADFDDFIERGDTRRLERAYTAQRVTELHRERPRRFGVFESVFGGLTGAAGVTRDVMRGIRDIREEATANVRAENALSTERIRKANTQLNFDLERSRLEAQISDQDFRRAQTESATQEVLEEAALRREERAAQAAQYRLERVQAEEAAKDEVTRRAAREERLRRTAAAHQKRASEAAAAYETLTTYAEGLEEGIHRRDADLNRREQEITRLQDELRRQRDENQTSERQRQEELRHAQHKARMAQAAAEKAKHEAAARSARGPSRTPAEEAFEHELAEQRQRQERVARLEAELARVGATYGTDSEIYRQRAAELDELRMKILGGEL